MTNSEPENKPISYVSCQLLTLFLRSSSLSLQAYLDALSPDQFVPAITLGNECLTAVTFISYGNAQPEVIECNISAPVVRQGMPQVAQLTSWLNPFGRNRPEFTVLAGAMQTMEQTTPPFFLRNATPGRIHWKQRGSTLFAQYSQAADDRPVLTVSGTLGSGIPSLAMNYERTAACQHDMAAPGSITSSLIRNRGWYRYHAFPECYVTGPEPSNSGESGLGVKHFSQLIDQLELEERRPLAAITAHSLTMTYTFQTLNNA